MIRFRGNLILTFEVSYLLNSNKKKFEDLVIYGTKSNIVWPKLHMTRLKNKKIFKLKTYEKKKACVMMLESFMKSIKHRNYDNRDLFLTKNTLKIISLLYKSARQGKEVLF